MDLTSWKTGLLKVSSLELDPLNPRLPRISDSKTTRDIVAALLEHEEVLDLTKSIVEFGGLYPNERLIAVEENEQKIVVEGNRRLAALKLLHSPELAPDAQVEQVRGLSNKLDPRAIEKVEVVIAPSRSVAARLIVARHTGEVVKRWSPAQQARYISTLVRPGYTIEEVAKDIDLPVGKVREFLRTNTMLQLAYIMPLAHEVRSKLDDKDEFSVTTLERLTESAEGRKFLGLSFDDDGNAVGEYDREDFKKAYTRIVTDVATGKINTRDLNTNTQIKKYLEGMGKAAPNSKKKGTWTSMALLSGNTEAASAAINKAKKPAKSSGRRDEPYLIPRGFRCALTEPRIREIFGELRRMKLGDFPNGCAVLARIFLELVVSRYLDHTGKVQPLLDKAKKDGKGKDWAPTLRQMIRRLLQDDTIQLKPQVRKAIDRMANNDDSLLSLDHLDQFVHNRYVAPSPRELRILWAALVPLLDICMVESPPADPTS